jgi:hypothetical protein
MPLIEELDIEVETLDSLEGLVVKPEAADKLAESASAIRLACAAVIARGSRPWDPAKKKSPRAAIYVAAAVLAALLAVLAYQWYVRRRSAATLVPAPQSQPARAPGPARGVNAPDARPVAPSVAPPAPVTIEGRGSRAGEPGNEPRSSVPDRPAEALKPSPPAVSAMPVTIEGRGSTAEQPGNEPRSSVLDPRAPARKPNPPAVSAPAGPAPLGDAVPRVTGILVSNNRRYATIEGGRIVGIGDVVGRRTVVGMDERSVLFREPSGVRLRIGLGGRLLAVEREPR